MKICGIYKITSPTGKIYVGLSSDIKERFYVYRRIRCTEQPLLFKSLCKYGWFNHQFEILEECLPEDLIKRETCHQIKHKVLSEKGLNIKIYHSDRNTVEYRTDGKDKPNYGPQPENCKRNVKVKDLVTGEIYYSIKHCAKSIGISYDALKTNLRGETKINKYPHIIYLLDEII